MHEVHGCGVAYLKLLRCRPEYEASNVCGDEVRV